MKALYTFLILILCVTVGYACTPGGTLNVNSNTTISATACYTDLTFSNNKILTIESPATLTITENRETIYTERIIVTKQNDSYFIDSLDLKRGSYVIRFEAPNGQVVAMKLIKN